MKKKQKPTCQMTTKQTSKMAEIAGKCLREAVLEEYSEKHCWGNM
jgi:hypothetical protein